MNVEIPLCAIVTLQDESIAFMEVYDSLDSVCNRLPGELRRIDKDKIKEINIYLIKFQGMLIPLGTVTKDGKAFVGIWQQFI